MLTVKQERPGRWDGMQRDPSVTGNAPNFRNSFAKPADMLEDLVREHEVKSREPVQMLRVSDDKPTLKVRGRRALHHLGPVRVGANVHTKVGSAQSEHAELGLVRARAAPDVQYVRRTRAVLPNEFPDGLHLVQPMRARRI